jgi:hypothetical protein
MLPLELALALGHFVVVGHLQAGPLEAALDIEALIGLGAVQDGLVAAGVLGDEVQRLDHLQTELLPLLVLCDRDVFNMTCLSEVVNAIL